MMKKAMDGLRGLWRGKRVDNKVWVEGYYIHLSENDLHIIVGLDGQYNRIEPETRGECASITDKNGVKIFEGDIVQECMTQDKATVKFVGGGFVFDYGDEARAMACTFRGVEKHVSVIGNVHDNPELLE